MLICVEKVVLDRLSTSVLLFGSAGCQAYWHDVTPVGYGGRGGQYGTISPVSTTSGPPTLKDRRATRGGEIKQAAGLKYGTCGLVLV